MFMFEATLVVQSVSRPKPCFDLLLSGAAASEKFVPVIDLGSRLACRT